MMKYKFLVVLLLVAGAAMAQRPSYQSLRLSDYFQLKTRPVTFISSTWDTTDVPDKRLVTIKEINDEINRRLNLLFNYINEVDVIETNNSLKTQDGLWMVNEAYFNVTTQNYTINLSYRNIEYTYSGGGGTFTLPVLNVDNNEMVFYIYNKTSGAITFNNPVWTDPATSTTTLAAGKWCKYYIDNNAGKIRALGGN